MDIPVNPWEVDKEYQIHDIVKVDNLAMYQPFMQVIITDDQLIYGNSEEPIQTDKEAVFITDYNREQAAPFDEITLVKDDEVQFGYNFPASPGSGIGFSLSAMLKKVSDDTVLNDEYKTYITEDPGGKVDVEKSVGVGIGIKFYDRNENYIRPNNLRNTTRAMASSELNSSEFYNVVIDIKPEDVPENAVSAGMFLFTYGLKQGGFLFKKMVATNTNPFFYCIKDHLSTFYTAPNNDGGVYWTQDFVWRPSYNSKSNFIAINEEMKMGEGQDYVTNASINALPMEVSLSFENRTDKEARAIVHFLQEKYFAYKSIFALNYDGNRLLSTEVQSFNFDYTFPYKKDLKYICTDFTHDIPYRNKNNVQAKFICNTESVLSSVESHAGYNRRLDALIPISIDGTTEFKKGEQITLNTFSLEPGEGTIIVPDVDKIEKYPESQTANITHGKVTFVTDKDFEVGRCMYIQVKGLNDSIFNIGKTKIVEKISPNEYVFSPVLSSGSIAELTGSQVIFKEMTVCPEECSYSRVLLPDGVDSIPSESVDPQTGETRKRQVYLKNYRRVQIDSDIYADTSSVTFTALENFTLEKEDDFWLLISAVRGRHSIYLNDPDRTPKYPWLEIRNLDHHASLSFSISHTPKHIQTDFTKYYNKRFKKEINQNLSTFNIVFDKRSDEEAAEILQFLESHLGYKKFRFQMPRPYIKDSETWTTPVREYTSTFYCPSWEHTVVYKNNNTISATLIESVTSISEDLRDVFGIGRDEKKPCYGAEIYDPITTHELCTFSPVLTAAGGAGFNPNGDSLGSSKKSVDIIFIVDVTGSMTTQVGIINGLKLKKFEIVMDLIKKMVTGYDENKFPGTNDYRNLWDAPDISFGSMSGNETSPPWPVKGANQESLISSIYDENKEIEDLLINNGYNTKNLDRFKIKIQKSKVNIGLIFMSENGAEDIKIPLSEYPQSFDKVEIYNKLQNLDDINHRQSVGGQTIENSPKAISSALAEFYNSPRAENVSERIILMLSDFSFYSEEASFSGSKSNRFSIPSLEMCQSLRESGELSQRRPRDQELKEYGYNSFTPFNYLESFKAKEKNSGVSYYNHPDKGEDNPDWYSEIVPTVFMAAKVGQAGEMSDYSPNYVYDYDGQYPNPGPFPKDYQFHFDLSSDPLKESERMMELISVVEKVTSDTGHQNIFSIVLYNCGPHDVLLKNTIFTVKSQEGLLKYTTEFLKSGITKGGSLKNLKFLLDSEGIDNIQDGYGGQFFGDPNNQKLLNNDSSDSLLWESFNTKYEVYRDGKIQTVNGGWSANSSESLGVRNTGVAFKGMPVRIFKTQSGLDIIDYNIGNAIESNQYKGDYSHLPLIKSGEKLDLFFGTRVNTLAASNEEVQLVINSASAKNGNMDCYANYNFNINVSVKKDTIGKEPVQEPVPIPPKATTGYVHLSGFLLASKEVGWYNKVFESTRNSVIIPLEPGETKEFTDVTAQIMGGREGVFGTGFLGIAATENIKVEYWGYTNFGAIERCGGCSRAGLRGTKFVDLVGPFLLNDYVSNSVHGDEATALADPDGYLSSFGISKNTAIDVYENGQDMLNKCLTDTVGDGSKTWGVCGQNELNYRPAHQVYWYMKSWSGDVWYYHEYRFRGSMRITHLG